MLVYRDKCQIPPLLSWMSLIISFGRDPTRILKNYIPRVWMIFPAGGRTSRLLDSNHCLQANYSGI